MELKQLKDFDLSIKEGSRINGNNEFLTENDLNSFAKYLTNKDYLGSTLNLTNNQYITKETTTKIPKNGELFLGSIAFTHRASIGSVGYVDKKLNSPTYVNNATLVINNNDERLYNKYLVYAFMSKFFQKKADKLSQRSIQKGLPINMFIEMEIPYYPIDEQKKIGDFLYNIDLLRRKNVDTIKKIEDYLSNLYTYWFLQFEFPNEKGQPYKSSGGEMVYNETLGYEIPKDWQDGTLGDIAEFVDGYTFKSADYKKNGSHFVVKVGDIAEDNSIKLTKNDSTNPTHLKIKKEQFLNLKDVVITMKGSIGKTALNHLTNVISKDATLNILSKNGDMDMFVKSTVLYNLMFKNYLKKSNKGSVIPLLTQYELKNFILQIPKVRELNSFNKETEGFLDLIVKLRQQNDQLEQMKDYYSELLFNGQIKIK